MGDMLYGEVIADAPLMALAPSHAGPGELSSLLRMIYPNIRGKSRETPLNAPNAPKRPQSPARSTRRVESFVIRTHHPSSSLPSPYHPHNDGRTAAAPRVDSPVGRTGQPVPLHRCAPRFPSLPPSAPRVLMMMVDGQTPQQTTPNGRNQPRPPPPPPSPSHPSPPWHPRQ